MLFFTRSLCIVYFLGLLGPMAAHALAPEKVCALHTARHERLKGIPRHLLASISKVESGHYDKETREVIAWPWTINAEGKGFRFDTKHEAVKAVRKMQREGIKSIDVGCMQVNLLHHKKAFRTLEDAFDPRKNVDYAARFLSDLKETHKSWTKAVAHYHSATPKFHRPYRKKVYDTWRAERRNDSKSPSTGKAVSHWASLRDRALAKNKFIKTPGSQTSLSNRYQRKKSARTATLQSKNPLDRFRARAQQSLMRLKQRRKVPKNQNESSSPIVLAGTMSSSHNNPVPEQTAPSFPAKRYASVRARARKLLMQSHSHSR